MSHTPKYIAGNYWVECSRCGFDYRKSEMTTEWTGLVVCNSCVDPRHPQEFVKAMEDKQAVDSPIVGAPSTPEYVDITFDTDNDIPDGTFTVD